MVGGFLSASTEIIVRMAVDFLFQSTHYGSHAMIRFYLECVILGEYSRR